MKKISASCLILIALVMGLTTYKVAGSFTINEPILFTETATSMVPISGYGSFGLDTSGGVTSLVFISTHTGRTNAAIADINAP